MQTAPKHFETVGEFNPSPGMRNSTPTENRAEIGFLSGFLTGFLFKKFSSEGETRRCANQKRKSGRGQKRGKGGSDPTLFGLPPHK